MLISTHLGAARANRKPVLQLLTARGETAGFAKISVNPLTRDLIRAERAALDTLAAANLRELTVPRVLHYGQWQGREVLVMNALPVWRRRRAAAPGAARRGDDRTRRRGRPQPRPAGGQRLTWPGSRSRLASMPGRRRTGTRWPPRSTRWPRPTRSSASAPGTATGPAGTWPAPPTGCWSGTGSDSPRPFRPASTPCTTGCRPPWSGAAAAAGRRRRLRAGRARGWLAPFGVPAAEARLIGVLYLAELSVRYLADRQAEAGARLGQPGTWLIPAIEEAMRNL